MIDPQGRPQLRGYYYKLAQLYFLGGGRSGPPRDLVVRYTPVYPRRSNEGNACLCSHLRLLTFSTSGGCGNSAVRCTCAACFPSPPTSLFSPVVLRLRTTLLLSRTLLSSPDDAAVSSRPPPSRTSPPPAADGLPATVLLRQLLPAHEALTHRLEGLLRGMRVRLIIWDFCLYCCGSILMRYCFSPSPLFLILW